MTPAPGYRLLDPGESLRRLNASLIEQGLSQATFATAVYGVIDIDTLEVRMAKAGHPSPVIFRNAPGEDGTSAVENFDADGCLLGIFPDEVFETRTMKLEPGDRMLVYSDGIEVAFGAETASGRAPDDMRWLRELKARRDLTAEQWLSDFAEHIDSESGSLEPRDDLTMIVIEVAR